MHPTSAPLPLEGVVVVDASRMLPGAVLARMLIDLGATLTKIEDPRAGDLMRLTPPLVGDGVGVGFAVYLRGAESVALDLRSADGAAALRHLAAGADLLLESFRPGTLDKWGLALDALRAANPRLITVSLPGYPRGDDIGHDLNFTARSGLLSRLGAPPDLPPTGVPALQFADVTAGTLACASILAALLARARTGRGQHITQSLAQAPLHFLTWAWAEAQAAAAAGDAPMTPLLLGGRCAAYRTYRCADGLDLAVGCLEPKFWLTFCQIVGLPELAAVGLDLGPAGADAIARVAAHLGAAPRQRWLDLLAPHGLPVTPVHDLPAALRDPRFADDGVLEATPLPGGGALTALGPSLASVARTPARPAPALGEHTRVALERVGAPADLIARLAP